MEIGQALQDNFANLFLVRCIVMHCCGGMKKWEAMFIMLIPTTGKRVYTVLQVQKFAK